MSGILAIIPARGGSSGLLRKNLKLLGGKPLIVHTIEAALEAKDQLYRVIVSTDDDEIAEVSLKAGAEVPFRRPADLSEDTTPSLPVVQHATFFIEAQESVCFDWILLLQPTTPLRNASDILMAVELCKVGDCDSVISVKEANTVHPFKMQKLVDGLLYPFFEGIPEGMRRQDYKPVAYQRNGGIYLTRRNVVVNQHSLYGRRVKPYIMPAERSVDIDCQFDLMVAELILRQQNLN